LFLLEDQPAPQPAPPAPQPAPRRGWWLARPLHQAGALAVRGDSAGPLMFESDAGATIFLDVLIEAAGQVALQGQLVADDQAQWTGALVEARQGGAVRAAATIDDLGGFSCTALAAVPTELRIIRSDGRALVVPEFEPAA
jgi:hypothetical protein